MMQPTGSKRTLTEARIKRRSIESPAVAGVILTQSNAFAPSSSARNTRFCWEPADA
jgi:hypothetical protein